MLPLELCRLLCNLVHTGLSGSVGHSPSKISVELGLGRLGTEIHKPSAEVQAMSLLWTLTFPISVLVCLAFWTLINPVWDLRMPPNYATRSAKMAMMAVFSCAVQLFAAKQPAPEVLLTEHFVNMLIFIAEFLVNRNVFYFKHGIILYIYALLCPEYLQN